ncbi:MAG: hypothetical protein IT538_05910, partial [Variibacter sp.]|nr:hypothetical protein [Variibacter sp.]
LVFLSTPPGSDITAVLPPEEPVSVFLPCTPNPTTGFFFYIPRREIIELPDVPVEAAAKLIMTAGMIQPGGGAEQNRSLAAMAAHARAAQAARAPAPAR